MKIQVISEGSTKMDHFLKRWGLSILIDDDVIFDTFCDPDLLKKDLRKFNIDIHKIKHIVISHEHWDHTGGLWYILENTEDARVYIGSQFSDEFKKKIKGYKCQLIEATTPIPIKENIFTSGMIEGRYKNNPIYEQSLIIKHNNTMAVITGCSHPGIAHILNRISQEYKGVINILLGGLHLMKKKEEEISETARCLDAVYNIDILAVFHCTGDRAIKYFEKHIPGTVQRIKDGDFFTFNPGKALWEYQERQ